MMGGNQYTSRSIDLANLLVYALPAGSHISTVQEQGGLTFTFEGFQECRALAAELRGAEPLAIGDLKAFLDAGQRLRSTIRVARSCGRWDRDTEVAA